LLDQLVPERGYGFTILKVISWILVAVSTLFEIKTLNLSKLRHLDRNITRVSKADLFVRNALLVGLISTFYPIAEVYSAGQFKSAFAAQPSGLFDKQDCWFCRPYRGWLENGELSGP